MREKCLTPPETIPRKRILVTGATGKQGAAVIDALLASAATLAFEIYALVPNASPFTKALEKRSPTIKVLVGDLNDCSAIFESAPYPIWGVFSVQTPLADSGSRIKGAEEKQGKALIDAALKNGAQHFIYSSVDRGGLKSDSNATNVPHFIPKYNIERYLKERAKGSGMTYTIFRSAAFFDNLTPNMVGRIFASAWCGMGKRKLQFVSVNDVGRFACMSFRRPAKFMNESISLAGDELTQKEANEVFKSSLSRSMPMTYMLFARIVLMWVRELGLMFRWFEKEGFGADIQECRKMNPEMEDLRKWLMCTSSLSS